MTCPIINYQLIYEEILPQVTKDALDLPSMYGDLSVQMKRLIEEVADGGAKRATEMVLDPEMMSETAELAAEMGAQLYQFANMLHNHTGTVAPLPEFETPDE